MIKKRINYYDNLKFLLITMVILGHFVDIYTKNSHLFRSVFIFIYSFHMPLFIFISGLFFKNTNPKSKIISYIMIGYILKILMFLLGHFSSQTYNFSLLYESYIPWFMFALSAYMGITHLLKNINKKYLLLFFVLLALFIGYDSSVRDYLCLSRIIVFYPFFLLGQIVNKDRIIEYSKNKKIKIASIFLLIIAILICYFFNDFAYKFRPLFTGRNPYNTLHSFSKYGCLLRGISYLISITLGFAFMMLVPNNETKYTKFGRKTLQMYFWHGLILIILNITGIQALLGSQQIGKTLWILLGFITTYLLTFDIFKEPTKKIIDICDNS